VSASARRRARRPGRSSGLGPAARRPAPGDRRRGRSIRAAGRTARGPTGRSARERLLARCAVSEVSASGRNASRTSG
jgi:hypothetical protein